MDHREAERKPPMLSFSRNHRVCICEYHDPVRTFDKRLPLSLSLFLSLDPPRVTPRTRTRVCIYIYIYTRVTASRLVQPPVDCTGRRVDDVSADRKTVRRNVGSPWYKTTWVVVSPFFFLLFFLFNNTNTKVIESNCLDSFS